ncbi:MAG: rhodanese-like domain-containing protein [Sulfuriferula sp.]
MPTISHILERALQRNKLAGLPYAGALTPTEAYFILSHAPGARLVDVRSHAEWDLVGEITGAEQLEWQAYPGWIPNAYFMQQLKQQVDMEALVMFICRSGERSHQAALVAHDAGYTEVYNVLEGFEGAKSADGMRGQGCGWKAAGLPWKHR